MSVNPFEAARMICTRRSWHLTAAEINAILYLPSVYHGGTTGAALLDAPFEAWQSGPVIPVLEGKIKNFGLRPVVDVFGDAVLPTPGSIEHKSLSCASDQLAGMSPFVLATKINCVASGWLVTYDMFHPGHEIALEALIEEFWMRMRADDGLFRLRDAATKDETVDDVQSASVAACWSSEVTSIICAVVDMSAALRVSSRT